MNPEWKILWPREHGGAYIEYGFRLSKFLFGHLGFNEPFANELPRPNRTKDCQQIVLLPLALEVEVPSVKELQHAPHSPRGELRQEEPGL